MNAPLSPPAARLLGLIGGTSWESTAVYYRLLNEGARERLGGLASARLVLSSVDFSKLEPLMAAGDWDGLGRRLNAEAARLARAGAELILLCTNTMHKAAAAMMEDVSTPFLDLRDVTGEALARAGRRRPLLLGTGYTMRDDFFTGHLARRFDLAPITPSAADQAEVHRIIFDELCRGVLREESRAAYRGVMERGVTAGADAVIFGCTEIGLLIGQGDTSLPVFDTAALHVDAALAFAFEPSPLPFVDVAG